jgi:hypothetical protein
VPHEPDSSFAPPERIGPRATNNKLGFAVKIVAPAIDRHQNYQSPNAELSVGSGSSD